MKYKSVWDEDPSELGELFNTWMDFAYDPNKPYLCIGQYKDNLKGARAIIGGTNNKFLFIVYDPRYIRVFNKDTFERVAFVSLPLHPQTRKIQYPVFVERKYNNNNTKKNRYTELILICRSTGLWIRFDEINFKFEFENFSIPQAISNFSDYSYICVEDCIYIFGGFDSFRANFNNTAYKYSMKKKEWYECMYTLPYALCGSVAIFHPDTKAAHIIGGYDSKTQNTENKHIVTLLKDWEDIKEDTTNDIKEDINEDIKEDINKDINENLKEEINENIKEEYKYTKKQPEGQTQEEQTQEGQTQEEQKQEQAQEKEDEKNDEETPPGKKITALVAIQSEIQQLGQIQIQITMKELTLKELHQQIYAHVDANEYENMIRSNKKN